MRNTVALVQKLRDTLPHSVVADPLVAGILDDVDGQVTESVSREEWYNRWGRHYLPSLFGAHARCFCNNFKDRGLQHFGGELFSRIRDDLDDIFLTLPPPKPRQTHQQKKPEPQVAYTKARQPPSPARHSKPQTFSMRSYYDYNSGCFHGDGKVVLNKNPDGSVVTKAARDICKGDCVLCADGSVATVICVVRTRLTANAPLVKLTKSGLIITPWHPVRLDGSSSWQFPARLPAVDATSIAASSSSDVYTYVLSNGHTVIVDGVTCVTLGHGFTDDICSHDFFGTNAVIDALKAIPGYATGLVDITDMPLKRDPNTNRVTGFSA